MAEPIGLAAGLLALATFAFQSSVSLHDTVQSFRSHQQRISDLTDELGALGAVLKGLDDTVRNVTGVDFATLKLPLLRCGTACQEFEKELLKCSSRTSENRTSFRDWAKLKYMGEDIDGFRRLLSGYKMTVTIALTDATLRKSSATAENLEAYNELLETAKAGLEDRLGMIDEKLELVLAGKLKESDQDALDIRTIRDERLSTEKCLQVCAQLSEHIQQIQLSTKSSSSQSASIEGTTSERITEEGLEECKIGLDRTVQRLRKHEREIFNQLMNKLKTATTSEGDRIELARLRDEWDSTRESMEICTRAHNYLGEGTSCIENYAVGDAFQFMVSTAGKTLHGKNRGLGWRTSQVGGHMSDDTVQHIATNLTNVRLQKSGEEGPSQDGNPSSTADARPEDSFNTKFSEQYGEGFKLTSKSAAKKDSASSESAKRAPGKSSMR